MRKSNLNKNKKQKSSRLLNLSELTKEVSNVGSIDGNYVGKFRLMLKASSFAPREYEVSLLIKHVMRVYLIFIIELCCTGLLAWYMYLRPDILLRILKVLFAVHGIFLIGGYLAIILLLFYAEIKKSLLLEFLSTIGIITVLGIPMGLIPILYDRNIIFEALALTIIIFASSALFGFLTKNNLTGWGAPLAGGLLALILLGFFQYYYQNSILNILILVADILVFTLYTAYDNQMIKIRFLDKLRDDIPDTTGSWWMLAMSSAIDIYLDFINLFLDILSLLGDDDD